MKLIKINENDNVAVALHPVSAGETVRTGGMGSGTAVTAMQDIIQGHKIALVDIKSGEDIIKYGFPIGHALMDIKAGQWIHTHNMATNLSGETEYQYHPETPETVTEECGTFMGFLRSDGRAGVRNEIWIIPTVGCVNDIARKLASDNQDLVGGTVDGLYSFSHPYGCSQTGFDHAQTRKLLAALVRHPDAGAVLVLSLGCENLTHGQFTDEIGEYDSDRVKFLTCQEVSDEFGEGRKLLEECADYAGRFERQEISMEKLVVGMKCGGSDGLSGITANPAAGKVSDMLIRRGASAILTEVPEMFGAEGFLMNRCSSREVFEKAVKMLNGFKDYFLSHDEVVYDNPSPGNKAGGITTLEDKSCGCVQKGGSSPIADVIGYGEQVVTPGLNMLYGPGNDLVSSTALAAAGAQIIMFTTGRGTPFGCPVPTLKIATNTELFEKKGGWIDFNAGAISDGTKTMDEAAADLFSLVLQTADGKKTKAERNGFRDIAIFKDGVTL